MMCHHATNLELLLGLLDHIGQSRHIELARNGKRIHKRVVHRILQDRVHWTLPCRRETGKSRMVSTTCSERHSDVLDVIAENLADAKHTGSATELWPKGGVNMPGKRR